MRGSPAGLWQRVCCAVSHMERPASTQCVMRGWPDARGLLLRVQVPPQNTNRMVDAARGVLNPLLADVYIFTDAMSGAAAGASPGYGLTLVAETTTGCLISAEAAATQVGMYVVLVCVCTCLRAHREPLTGWLQSMSVHSSNPGTAYECVHPSSPVVPMPCTQHGSRTLAASRHCMWPLWWGQQ